MMSGPEARGKWDAWEAKKGMSTEDAQAAYVDLVKGILGEWFRIIWTYYRFFKNNTLKNKTILSLFVSFIVVNFNDQTNFL